MKIASIVGARPEFVQAAMVSHALRKHHEEVLIHTGQHYDDLMSDVFFRQLSLPQPDVNLNVGSAAPSKQTSEMLVRLADIFERVRPDVVIVRGDTNSTLAAALAARQNSFALAHIESGMRSYDSSMPEEVNRVLTDHMSDLLFATGDDAAENLRREGLTRGVHVVGDVMYDTYLRVVEEVLPNHRCSLSLPERYALLTIHRSGNTDDPGRLRSIIEGFRGSPFPVVFPVHPRTAKRLQAFGIDVPSVVRMVEPLSYLDMLVVERSAQVIFTDSGGVQREAYFGAIPCVTLREETEWTGTVESGWNRLAGADTAEIAAALMSEPPRPRERPSLFGDGLAAVRIAQILEDNREPIERWEAVRNRATNVALP